MGGNKTSEGKGGKKFRGATKRGNLPTLVQVGNKREKERKSPEKRKKKKNPRREVKKN